MIGNKYLICNESQKLSVQFDRCITLRVSIFWMTFLLTPCLFHFLSNKTEIATSIFFYSVSIRSFGAAAAAVSHLNMGGWNVMNTPQIPVSARAYRTKKRVNRKRVSEWERVKNVIYMDLDRDITGGCSVNFGRGSILKYICPHKASFLRSSIETKFRYKTTNNRMINGQLYI